MLVTITVCVMVVLGAMTYVGYRIVKDLLEFTTVIKDNPDFGDIREHDRYVSNKEQL